MTNERYVFIQDVREKKNIARSSHNRRTHCGKSGGVKLPSDYLSTKEKRALNGSVKTYQLSKPMKWFDFKYMPKDLQIDYITELRDRYGASANVLAEMFGVSHQAVSSKMRDLGIGAGRGVHRKLDEEGWARFLAGEAEDAAAASCRPCGTIPSADEEPVEEPVVARTVEVEPPVMRCGSLTFEGDAAGAFATALSLIGTKKVKVTVSWEVLE